MYNSTNHGFSIAGQLPTLSVPADRELIERITAALPRVPTFNQTFVLSVVGQYHRKGHLSEKQAAALYRILVKLETPAEPKAIINLAPVHALLMTAKNNGLKQPRINIIIDGHDLRISMAGPNSRNPGYLYIQEGDKYGGKISPSGEWTGETALVSSLQALAADPARIAGEHGRMTKECCFCSRGLTDDRSRFVGYGPVCAEKFGLPWGEVGN